MILRRVIRLEYSLELIRGNSPASIVDAYDRPAIRGRTRNPDTSPFRSGVHGVNQKIRPNLVDLSHVALDRTCRIHEEARARPLGPPDLKPRQEVDVLCGTRTQRIGQQVVIDNRGGAGGTTGK